MRHGTHTLSLACAFFVLLGAGAARGETADLDHHARAASREEAPAPEASNPTPEIPPGEATPGPGQGRLYVHARDCRPAPSLGGDYSPRGIAPGTAPVFPEAGLTFGSADRADASASGGSDPAPTDWTYRLKTLLPGPDAMSGRGGTPLPIDMDIPSRLATSRPHRSDKPHELILPRDPRPGHIFLFGLVDEGADFFKAMGWNTSDTIEFDGTAPPGDVEDVPLAGPGYPVWKSLLEPEGWVLVWDLALVLVCALYFFHLGRKRRNRPRRSRRKRRRSSAPAITLSRSRPASLEPGGEPR